MNRKDLADEIRGAGFALRYADGPVVGVKVRNGKRRALESPRHRLMLSDWKLIRTASTCSDCRAVASKSDIELAEQWADCYQSFARLIWPCIDHASYCGAEPYIPVSEDASKYFAKVKAQFERKRQEREARKAAQASGEPSTKSALGWLSRDKQRAAAKIAALEAELEATKNALQKKKQRTSKKAPPKKTTQAKKKTTKKKSGKRKRS